MLNKSKGLVLVVVCAGLIAFSFTKGQLFEVTKNLDLFVSLYKELSTFYVDELNDEELLEEGYKAMLKSLDPYTTFYPAEELEGYTMQISGKYGGIGAIIRKQGDYVVVAEPYENFPAFKAGLIAGDRILKVGGVEMTGKGTSDVSNILRGQAGTMVKVLIERPLSGKIFEKTLVREEIKIDAVPYAGMLENDVAYIRLGSFTNDCSREVRQALLSLRQEQELKGLVLDLRGNPGGLLQEAVKVSGLFLDRGKNVVSTRGRDIQSERRFKTNESPIDAALPLVVLTNKNSASASEIVSGVLQDHDRGVVMGQTTFGKGLVQTTMELDYNSKLKLTTSKYYLPSGRCIQAIDYSGQYQDGTDKVADSLRTPFETEAGRTVFDAGGVDPDVELEPKKISHVARSLDQKQLFFEFANQYHANHPTIAPAASFEIDDVLFEEFVDWLKSRSFDYTSKSEQTIAQLREQVTKEGKFDELSEDMLALEELIKIDKEKDLRRYKEELSDHLLAEIVSRYYYQKGRLESALQNDDLVNEAVELLSNPAKYDELLRP